MHILLMMPPAGGRKLPQASSWLNGVDTAVFIPVSTCIDVWWKLGSEIEVVRRYGYAKLRLTSRIYISFLALVPNPQH